MDQRLKKIFDNMDTLTIGLNDTFYFKCRGCGKCCRERYDILLNPRDLFRIARHLHIQIEDVLKKYCDVYAGQDSMTPLVRLLPVGGNNRCPFLVDKRCIVHEAKPVVCALFPIGRTVMAGDMEKGLGPGEPMVTGYICQEPDCGAKKKPQVVREWLAKWGYDDPDEFYLQWNELMIDISLFMHELEKLEFSAELIRLTQETLFQLIYLGYDLNNDDILGQFQPKMTKATSLIEVSRKKAKELRLPAPEGI